MSGYPELLCGACRQRQPLWQEALCRECKARSERAARRQTLRDIVFRWLIASGLEAALGAILGLLLLIPLMSALVPSVRDEVSPLGLVVGVLCAALLVGGIQVLSLSRWIRERGRWGRASSVGVIASWVAMLLLVRLSPTLLAFQSAPLIEAASGMLVATLQAAILRRQGASGSLWLVGSLVCWIVAGLTGLAVELLAADPVMGVITALAASRCVYGATSSMVLAVTLAGAAAAPPTASPHG